MADYKLSQVVNNEYKDFAIYTVENRAIPSIMDGLKPVNRFYLYSSIKNSKNDFKKVSAVAGVISDYGYNHGEASAQGAGQLMAAEWNNNLCIIQGRGNFGSRLVPDPAAPRYTYSKVHENFNLYFKDNDLAPVHKDVEHAPPAFYLPILPVVVINGAMGIATGFSVNILPRSVNDVEKSVLKVLNGTKLKANSIKPSFPQCSNSFEWDKANGSWIESVPFKQPSATKLIIEDVLYGTSREDYIDKVLEKLEDDDDIVGYDDLCSKEGFKFEVTLKRNRKYTEAQIIKLFKLRKSHKENINVIDENGKLEDRYTCVEEIIEDFVAKRMPFLEQRIEKNKSICEEKARYSSVVIQYIEAVLDDKIVFKKGKKTAQVEKEILQHTEATEDDTPRLLRMTMSSLTAEKVTELKAELKSAKDELNYWKKTDVYSQYIEDVDSL